MNMRAALALLLLASLLITCVQGGRGGGGGGRGGGRSGGSRGGRGGGGGGGGGGGTLSWWLILIIVLIVGFCIFFCVWFLCELASTEEAEVVEEGAGDKDTEEIPMPRQSQNKPVQVQIGV